MYFSTIHVAAIALLIASAAAFPAPRINSQESLATLTSSKTSTLPDIPTVYVDINAPMDTGHRSTNQESKILEDSKDLSELVRRTPPGQLIAHHNSQAKWHGLAATADTNHAKALSRQIPTAPAHQRGALEQEYNERMRSSQDHRHQAQGHAAAVQHIQGLVDAAHRETTNARSAHAAAAQHRSLYDTALRNGRMGDLAHHEHNERAALTAAENHDRNAATYHHQAANYHNPHLRNM